MDILYTYPREVRDAKLAELNEILVISNNEEKYKKLVSFEFQIIEKEFIRLINLEPKIIKIFGVVVYNSNSYLTRFTRDVYLPKLKEMCVNSGYEFV